MPEELNPQAVDEIILEEVETEEALAILDEPEEIVRSRRRMRQTMETDETYHNEY
jgi:hypothetical protein